MWIGVLVDVLPDISLIILTDVVIVAVDIVVIEQEFGVQEAHDSDILDGMIASALTTVAAALEFAFPSA